RHLLSPLCSPPQPPLCLTPSPSLGRRSTHPLSPFLCETRDGDGRLMWDLSVATGASSRDTRRKEDGRRSMRSTRRGSRIDPGISIMAAETKVFFDCRPTAATTFPFASARWAKLAHMAKSGCGTGAAAAVGGGWPRNRLVAPPLKASMLCSQTASLPPPPAASQISSIYCE
uniref:Uncharacterized protein n=1 Tax=Aegilops tauschii subsp. strangulata TaxID=200361 RepID=A0A453QF29_AEGTS